MFLEEFSSFRDSILKYSWMKQISWGGEKRWDKVGHKFIIFILVISQWRFIILCSSLLYLCRGLYLVIFFNGNDWTKWSLRLFLFLIFCNLLFSINYLSLICPFQEPSNLNWLHLFMHASWNILRSGARKKIKNPYFFFFFFKSRLIQQNFLLKSHYHNGLYLNRLLWTDSLRCHMNMHSSHWCHS